MTQTRDNQTAQHTPIACTLSAEGMAQRGAEVARMLSEGRQETRELPDGYAVRFPGDDAWASRLLAFITAERACCPFFTFELVFEPGPGPLWLRLRGPEGAKAIAASLVAA